MSVYIPLFLPFAISYYIDRKVPEKTWISCKKTAQWVWMVVGLEITTFLVVRKLVESFCHVPKGAGGGIQVYWAKKH